MSVTYAPLYVFVPRGRGLLLAQGQMKSRAKATATSRDRLGPRGQLVALGLRDSVLADFVEQRFVTDLQQRRSLLAVPVSLIERMLDGFSFRFVLGAARHGF